MKKSRNLFLIIILLLLVVLAFVIFRDIYWREKYLKFANDSVTTLQEFDEKMKKEDIKIYVDENTNKYVVVQHGNIITEDKEFLESYKTEGISIYLVYDNDNNEHIIVKENDKIISEYNVWPEDNSKIKQLR